MASFLGELTLTPTVDGDRWRLDTEFNYWTDVIVPRYEFAVPKGFVTDLASIPRIFWNILPPFGKYTGAAVVHDYIYTKQAFVRLGFDGFIRLTRKQCDDILMEAMGVLGVSWAQRWTIYIGVRVGGWVAWNQHIKENEAAKARAIPAPAPES